MTTIEEAAQYYLEGCIRAYLHKKNSINWIMGIIRGVNPNEIQQAIRSVENPDPIYKNELLRRLGYV